jgi:hypothetical protein
MKRIILLFTAIAGLMLTASAQSQKVDFTVNGHKFVITLESNATATAFKALLPMTIDMTELNGNEKYHYLSTTLPTNASNPGTINAGDVMLYGNSCIVVFYKTFATSYSYTRIGHIDDPTDIATILGSGNISASFAKETATAIIVVAPDAIGNYNVYDLNGRLVRHNASDLRELKGAYIVNGKKIILNM